MVLVSISGLFIGSIKMLTYVRFINLEYVVCLDYVTYLVSLNSINTMTPDINLSCLWGGYE